jgi:uncharacterized membrane protein YukC
MINFRDLIVFDLNGEMTLLSSDIATQLKAKSTGRFAVHQDIQMVQTNRKVSSADDNDHLRAWLAKEKNIRDCMKSRTENYNSRSPEIPD